jgi:hypothetical protein
VLAARAWSCRFAFVLPFRCCFSPYPIFSVFICAHLRHLWIKLLPFYERAQSQIRPIGPISKLIETARNFAKLIETYAFFKRLLALFFVFNTHRNSK